MYDKYIIKLHKPSTGRVSGRIFILVAIKELVEDVLATASVALEDVLATASVVLADVFATTSVMLEDVLTTALVVLAFTCIVLVPPPVVSAIFLFLLSITKKFIQYKQMNTNVKKIISN